MQHYRLMQILTAVLFLLPFVFVSTTTAENTSEIQVEATIISTFETGSQLSVRAQMIVNRISNIYETTYTRQMIETMTDSDVLAVIKNQLHILIKNQIEEIFQNADVSAITKKPSYEIPYFIDEFHVNLTASFFHYNGSMNLTNFINGALDMGATVTYHFNVQAEQGWNITYCYVLPNTTTLTYANTAETNPITWVVRNWDGNDTGKDATLSINSKNPTTPISETEDIALEFILDTRTIDDISFTNSIVVKKMNVDSYNVLPEFITGLDNMPADGVRLCIDSGLFSWTDFFEKTIRPIEQQTTPLIENSSFQQTLDLSFTWDAESSTNCSTPYNITHMDDAPAIRANFKDPDVNLQICQMSARAFFGLINAGANASIAPADVNFGSDLDGITHPFSITLRLPTNISLNGDNVYTWNKTTPIAGEFLSGLQPTPPYREEHIETRVEIELLKMDLNVPSVFTGKTELTASTKMREDDRLYVIRRDGEISFFPKVNITYLNSDAFRLCTEENVFSESQISSFLSKKTEMFQQRLSEIFHGLRVKGIIDRKIFLNSLVWDGDISAMDNVVPVVVSNYANEVYAVGFNVSLWPAELTLAPQRFTFQGVENQTVIYRIIFPRGITVNASDNAGKTLITGKTNDGRDYVELSIEAGSATQSTVLICLLAVSPVYILGLFLPCILVFTLLVVLVIIIYLIRKKRGGLKRGKKKLFEREDNEPSDYGGQDYYVPPPPSSSKKKK
jgi:catabolite regulation protein CreA